MRAPHLIAITAGLSILVGTASAQFVKGNEAVKFLQDGRKRVVTPPLPTTGPARSLKLCGAKDGCHGGAWLMVETEKGLMECTDAYARPGTCRESSYGTSKLPRVWVVLSQRTWRQCQLPDTSSRCVDMFARPPANMPFPAVQ